MKYLATALLVFILTAGADGALYAYAFRERTAPAFRCDWGRWIYETNDRRESREIGLFALAANGVGLTCLAVIMFRWLRDGDLLDA